MEKISFKNLFKNWTGYEIFLVILGFVLPISFSVIFGSSVIECIVTCLSTLVAVLFTKGYYWGYIIAIINLIFYSIVEFGAGFYGELFINWGLYFPMYVFGLVEWLKHQDKEKSTIVIRKSMNKKEYAILIASQIVCWVPYYFILLSLNTTNPVVSALSIAASFVASYLSARRSLYCFAGYIVNDLVCIILWAVQTITVDIACITVLLSPVLLLLNDIYGIVSWYRLREKQKDLDDFGNKIGENNEENKNWFKHFW